MNKLKSFLAKTVKFVKTVYKLATDKEYRQYFQLKYISWKVYAVAIVMAMLMAFGGLNVYRWDGLKECWGEQWDTGRDTKFSYITNGCVIDTGKVDANGDKIWNKVKRDIGQGTDIQ